MYDQGYERTTELFVIPCDYYRYEMIIIVIIIVTIEFEKEPFSKAWNPISERGRYALKVTAQKKKNTKQNKTKQKTGGLTRKKSRYSSNKSARSSTAGVDCIRSRPSMKPR